jgi:hypothetical protein
LQFAKNLQFASKKSNFSPDFKAKANSSKSPANHFRNRPIKQKLPVYKETGSMIREKRKQLR